jgi:renal tumor antigen
MKNFELKEGIGMGSYGKVYRAFNKTSFEKCAIKKLNHKIKASKDLNSLNEIASLSVLKHEGIINLFEVIRDETGEVNMVLELADQSLRDVIDSNTFKAKLMPYKSIKRIMYQLLKAVDYIHSKGYIHKDIKPENILLKDNKVKICDFGFCEKSYVIREYIGTRVYRSPECLLRMTKQYSSALDIWGVGAIMFELFTNITIFEADSEPAVIDKIVNLLGIEELSKWEEGFYLLNKKGYLKGIAKGNKISEVVRSEDGCDLLTQLLCFNPEKRITAREALRHPYFDELRVKPVNKLPEYNPYSYRLQQRYSRNIEVNDSSLPDINLFQLGRRVSDISPRKKAIPYALNLTKESLPSCYDTKERLFELILKTKGLVRLG